MHGVPLRSLRLTAPDQRALHEAAQAILRMTDRHDFERWSAEAHVNSGRLSDVLLREFVALRRFGAPAGGLLVQGVPLGEVPPTPVAPGQSDSAPEFAAAALSVLIGPLGDQYGFQAEGDGRIVQDIVPVAGYEDEQISVSSTSPLVSHTETAFSEYRCDFVALLCLRQDHDRRAGATLHPVDAMLPLLDRATTDVLRQPRFRTRVDLSFRLAESEGIEWVEPIQVLSGPNDHPHIRFDTADTEGRDDEASLALKVLAVAVEEVKQVVYLVPGDLLLIDNRRALHGRTGFVPRYDGNDRWLLRTFVTRDLTSSRAGRANDGRVVTSWRAPR